MHQLYKQLVWLFKCFFRAQNFGKMCSKGAKYTLTLCNYIVTEKYNINWRYVQRTKLLQIEDKINCYSQLAHTSNKNTQGKHTHFVFFRNQDINAFQCTYTIAKYMYQQGIKVLQNSTLQVCDGMRFHLKEFWNTPSWN